MRQLVTVSTLLEISPFIEKFAKGAKINGNDPIKISDNLFILISGIGSPSTIFNLTRILSREKYERVIQIGIAGSFNRDFSPGSLWEVADDCFADLGIDNKGDFTSVFEEGLVPGDKFPFTGGRLINPNQNFTGLPEARSITVNTVSGSRQLIEQRKSVFNPDIESMEGAAAFFTCIQMGVPVIQVRAVSNMVEPREKSNWNIDFAVAELNNWLEKFVKAE